MTVYPARPNQFTPLTTAYMWEKLFGISGIWDGVGSQDLAPSLTAGPSVTVQPGTCVIKGQIWYTDAAIQTAIAGNSSGYPRIDKLVLQYDRTSTSANGVVSLIPIQGTPAANPQPPNLTQTPVGSGGTGQWQIPVAQWQVNNGGAVVNFLDIRQFNGHSALAMTSANRPIPPSPRLGLEIDTGYLLLYDINAAQWRGIGPKNQIYTTGFGINKVAPAQNLHTPFTIPANDVNNATLGTVTYRIRCGGGGHQATGAVATFVFALAGFGVDWGSTSTGQIIPVGQNFNWHYDIELAVKNDGSGSLYGDITVSQATANPGNAQSVYNVQKQYSPGSINFAPATTLCAQAYVSTVSGAPSLQCVGATYERITN